MLESRDSLDIIIQTIRNNFGLYLRDRDVTRLRHLVGVRQRALGLSPDKYAALLNSHAAPAEWNALIPDVTNTETFFFRDTPQIEAVRKNVLPRIIEARRTARRMRLWSAGCSNGAECYTLAILALEAVSATGATPDDWDIDVLGTDIHGPALETARRGVYTEWVLRGLDDSTRDRWFHRQSGKDWRIRDTLRERVHFATMNLSSDEYPGNRPEFSDIDLILCRNVFIYFAPEAIARTLTRFETCLCEGGFLVTGHAELYGQSLPGMTMLSFAGSLAYQKTREVPPEVSPLRASPGSRVAHAPTRPPLTLTTARKPVAPLSGKIAVLREPESNAASSSRGALRDATDAIRRGDSQLARRLLTSLLAGDGVNAPARCLAARAAAESGANEDARTLALSALEANPLATDAYRVLAAVARESGDTAAAIEHLKKAHFLTPEDIGACLDLASLYEQTGNHSRSHSLRVAARGRLRAMPPEELVDLWSPVLVGEMLAHVEEVLADASLSGVKANHR